MKFIENNMYNSKYIKGNIAQSATVEKFERYSKTIERIGKDEDK
jgi:hypothetical protein